MMQLLRDTKVRISIAAIVILLFISILLQGKSVETTPLRTAKVTRGDLLVTISATGTVEPEEVIDVGAQVGGLILSFGKDTMGKAIDYGSQVEEGTILAQIDQSLYQTDAAQADAQLKRANADLLQSQAKLDQAEADWKRAQKLSSSEALSHTVFDGYKASYQAAQANVAVSNAEVVQAQAVLDKANRNLNYCVIKSPVKGVIIDRRVNIGQTVVSSLNAPSLFLIAKDLTHMQVWVSVNEADIGNIHPGQAVTFNVDAFPGESFTGSVGKIRLNATMLQNVVTYVVEVLTDNSKNRLLPYLTANIKFQVNDEKNVLLIPNASLRWTPNETLITPDSRGIKKQEKIISDENFQEKNYLKVQSTIWIPDGNFVRPLKVIVKGSDGVNSAIESKEIQDGSIIIVGGGETTTSQPSTNTNPFTPAMPSHGKRG